MISNSRCENNLYRARIPELRDQLQCQDVTWHAVARGAFARVGNHSRSPKRDRRRKQMLLIDLHRLEAESRWCSKVLHNQTNCLSSSEEVIHTAWPNGKM